MMMLEHNGHRIEVRNSWLGLERVSYDGGEVARRRTLLGGTHVFAVVEDEEKIVYEVRLEPRLFGHATTVRRNGVAIFTNR